jgi:hypothetical protein
VKCDCAGLLCHTQVYLRPKECDDGKDVTDPARTRQRLVNFCPA